MKTEHKVPKIFLKVDLHTEMIYLTNKSRHIKRKKRRQKGRWGVHLSEKAPNTVFRLKEEPCQITMKWVMGSRMATKMGLESDPGNAMGSHSSLPYSNGRISFLPTQRKNGNSHDSLLTEAVEGSADNAAASHVGASRSRGRPTR